MKKGKTCLLPGNKKVLLCLKTKSNIFLFAYILFLFYSLVMYHSWDETTSHRIIIAIVVAGTCFSVAELFFTIRDIKNAQRIKLQELYAMSIKAIKDLSEKGKSLLLEREILLRERYLDVCKTDIRRKEEDYRIYEEEKEKKKESELRCQKTISNLEEEIKTIDKNENSDSILGNIFMVIGILLFFVLMTFDVSVSLNSNVCNYLTILAFVFLVSNYYIKQLYIVNMEDTLAETRKKCLMGEKFE